MGTFFIYRENRAFFFGWLKYLFSSLDQEELVSFFIIYQGNFRPVND